MAKSRYREGDWFAVPLRVSGYALGVVARASRRGVLLGYFFGPHFEHCPSLDEVNGLCPGDAILVGRFGHLGLQHGDWAVLGHAAEWDRAQWPTPEFLRYEELTGRSLRVIYDDDDPAEMVREYQVAPGVTEQAPVDSMMGAGFVEIRLTSLLR